MGVLFPWKEDFFFFVLFSTLICGMMAVVEKEFLSLYLSRRNAKWLSTM